MNEVRDRLFAEKLPPLELTSRPLTDGELMSPAGSVNLWQLQLCRDRSLLQRLLAGLRDALFPPKQPPLQLTSQPVKPRDLWGAYRYRKDGVAVSALVHLLLAGALVVGSVASFGKPKVDLKAAPLDHIALVLPADVLQPISPKKSDPLAGGGGGGDRDKLQAPQGKLPRFALEQLAPPAMVIRNRNPKLAVEPTVVMPPDMVLPVAANFPNLGDPLSRLPSGPPSNGTGSGGGIGSGRGGGVGAGEGPGVGPGRGGGFGGNVFNVGAGVSAPKLLFSPDPEYSEEARRAKHQGICVLWLIVGPDGRPRDVQVARTLGLGLDQKAVEAVRQWKFEPARKDGQPVAVQINVEVNFKLY